MKKSALIYDKATHEARKYWRDRLDAMSFGGPLALDHPRPLHADGAERPLASYVRPLAPETHALLRRLSGGNPSLVYTALLSALEIACSKVSGEREVTIWSPATAESAVATLLPIHCVVDGSSAFKEVLLAIKELLAGAFRHQEYPFPRLLLDLPDDRRPKELAMVAGMAGLNEELPEAPWDVCVLFDSTAEETKATFRFDARLYDEPTILHFSELLEEVLRQGLGAPAARIADLLPPVAPAAGEGVEGGELLLHRLIEVQAARHPEGIAVSEAGRETTYGALERDALRLAETLRSLGLDGQRPVALLMEAGTEWIVSLLAALKAGAAFAPLKLLSARGGPIGGALDALDARCILCRPEHLPDLQPILEERSRLEAVVTVEYRDDVGPLEITCQGAPGSPERAPGAALSQGGDTACILLVDGREGNPALSRVTHAELASGFRWINGRSRIGPGDRCLLPPGLAPSEQLYGTLGMLCAGGAVEIAGAAEVMDTSLLAKRLMAPAITVWDLPTPLAQNLLGSLLALRAERPDLSGPRQIFLSGEMQSVRLAERLAELFQEAQITGFYASPAIGIWSTFFPLSADAMAQAIPGFEHRVVHRSGEPAPPFTQGGLQIKRLLSGSAPVVDTGLRAAALAGGRLRWLRGEDHRFVKYGCTVELTRIEEALCRHEQVRAAEVLAVPAETGADWRIVAFVLAAPGEIAPEALSELLVERGEVDLIPDRFVVLDELPLTAEGAIDRAALLARFLASREGDLGSLAVDDIHRQLREIWLEILQVDDVADNESFFSRGGNSLKATLLIARIDNEFGVDLPVQKFFREPNTRAMAQLIAAEAAGAANLKRAQDVKIVSREKYRVRLPDLES